MKTHTTIYKVVAVMLIMVTCFGALCTEALAAKNVCTQIRGSAKRASTFYVETGSRWIASRDCIRLTQTQGVMNRSGWTQKAGTFKAYGGYSIRIEKLNSTGRVVSRRTENWNYIASKTIRLDRNSTYRITITPKSLRELQAHFLLCRIRQGYVEGWKTAPSWTVTRTKGVLSCR